MEPLIAASIAYVGIENIRSRALGNSRLVLVFAFGLLHGLGFASVLAEFGLERGAFMTSLISFNIGVELGQLTILLACVALIGFLVRAKRLVPKNCHRTSIHADCDHRHLLDG